ncbi:MAG TPA: cell division protein ZapB [Spirochaetia bacterium]|nr:cell division protein ZapB [Spirochaetales bacterium]HQG40152.1 cell division protein ZapB [Spirochaetales bacterium]HQK34926.1 cell division protein ZapB [Spirochaetales bacterium]HRS65469.1 cell division protein ZapB [Spirochaetia bacterium]HRV29652.1 cell division protein ZapB [Spirochaetia bacterium]
MLTLEQVKTLESKVERAVQVINALRTENKQLKTSLQSANRRIAELEGLLHTVEQEQGRIEEGFKEALRKLDELEDSLFTGAPAKSTEVPDAGKVQNVSAVQNTRIQDTVGERSSVPGTHEQLAVRESEQEPEELIEVESEEKTPDQLF